MGDFAQNSPVPTLHNFNTKSLESMENDLKLFSGYRPMELILLAYFPNSQVTLCLKLCRRLVRSTISTMWLLDLIEPTEKNLSRH